jgi:hypothetical protein
MKLTIIVEDNIVAIDGVVREVALPNMGEIRAVQWDGTKGHIEYINSQNAPLKNINAYANIVALWEGAAPVEPDPEVPNPIPQAVTMRQARLALLANGLLASVAPAIATLPNPQRQAAEVEWEYSQEVHRDKPLVAILGVMLGLSSSQLDDLFVLAKTL